MELSEVQHFLFERKMQSKLKLIPNSGGKKAVLIFYFKRHSCYKYLLRIRCDKQNVANKK